MNTPRPAHLAYGQRCDSLPEDREYRDDGCDLSPSCLRCPLPVCRYDDKNAVAVLRAEIIRRGRDAGMKVDDIARIACCGRRTVFRVLEESRS